MALIISIHNLPMGIVLGAGDESEFGIALLRALILHNVPEGMILFTLLFIAGFSTYMLFLISIIVAVPVGLGAFIGELIGMQNKLL
ncbi:ZIP family metal transporter [Sporosarcina sp. UB5]|uniref:ZIP family metal transporter n=1 Tax=Sporosarcina sp. UB5 TaxID=3047463 RepID=UPI003D799EF3